MKKIYLLYFISLISIITNAQINKFGIPFTTNYTTEDYKSEAQNWSVTIDNRGVLYFANNVCVLEYDGQMWTSIPLPNNIIVRSLKTDKNGTVFVGAYNNFGYLAPDKNGELKFYSLANKVDTMFQDFGDVWKIFTTNDAVFFTTNNHVFKYNYSTVENLNTKSDNSGNLFFFVIDGYIFLGNFFKGLEKLENPLFSKFLNSDFFSGMYITSVSKISDIEFLVTTFQNGAYIFDFENGIDTNQTSIPEISNKIFKTSLLLNSFKLNRNTYVFSTNNNGLIFTDNQFNIIHSLSRNENLSDNTCYETIADTTKLTSSWSALNNGIAKIEYNSPFKIFDKSFGYEGSVYDIIKFQNTIYFSTNVGVYYLDFENNLPVFKKISIIDENTSAEAWSFEIITENNQEKLLVGTNFGIFYLENFKSKLLLIDNDMSKSDIPTRFLKISKINNRLLIGTTEGLKIIENKNNSWTKIYGHDFQFEFRSICEDNYGNIWCGTNFNGLVKIDTSFDYQIYGTDKGLIDTKNPIVSFIDQDLIIATPNGIFTYSEFNDTIIPFNQLNSNINIPNESYYVFENTNNKIWFSCYGDGYETIKEISLIDSNKYSSIPFKRVDFKGIQTLYIDDDSILWIGTPDAVYTFDTKYRKDYNVNFNTLIRKVQLKNDSVLFNGTYFSGYGQDSIMLVSLEQPQELIRTLEYSENTIFFEWSAAFFENEEANMFSYKLEEFDKEWSKWSTETKFVYTNLPEGEYTFKVKSKNVYGTEGTIAEYKFEILPPWYRTIFAYISYFVISLLIIFIVVKWYSRKLKRENIRLEKIVDERTKEIRLKNTELEQQKEEIITQAEELEAQRDLLLDKNAEIEEKNQNIHASIQYASRIQRAILPPLNPLENNFTEHFILYKPRDIVSGDFYWLKCQDNRTYVVAADCTGHGVPGAFMSMLGVSLLNEIVEKHRGIEANEMLDLLRENVIKSLHQRQEHTKTQDGMDLSLLVYNKQTNEVSFAGANNPLIIVRNNSNNFKDITNDISEKKYKIMRDNNSQTILIELKADKMPIGIYIKDNIPFTQYKFTPQKGDTMYIFSDGFPDQFGGEKGQKYMIKKLKQFLIQINNLSLNEQKKNLNEEFNKWINTPNIKTNKPSEQTDDVIILALKF